MKKKVLKAGLLALAAIVLVVATVLATIAYLTASSAVSNVFTVGDVAIAMFEHKVNEDGELVTPSSEVDANSYKLVPAHSYVKDPTIRIKSGLKGDNLTSDTMYLFVKSNNQIREIEAANVDTAFVPGEGEYISMRKQMEANGWVELVQSGDGIEIVWVYGTRNAETGVITATPVNINTVQKHINADGTVTDRTDAPAGEFRLCEGFTLDSDANVSLYAAAKVTFTGFAIQDSGLETAKEAWEALKAAYPYEGGIINPVNPYDNNLKDDDAYAPIDKNGNVYTPTTP